MMPPMARFPWRMTSSLALAALLFAAGCSSVPSPPTLRDAAPPPARGQSAVQASTRAVEIILKPVMDEGGWTATADLPPVVNARLMVTLEAGLKSANPGEEIEMAVLAAPAAPARAAQTTLRVLDVKSTQQVFIGGVTNLPAGAITVRLLPVAGRPANLALERLELRAVPDAVADDLVEQRNYPGRSPRAAWRTAAAARVEELRKAPARISVLDAAGAPMRSAMVELTLLQPTLRIAAQSQTLPDTPPPRDHLVNTWIAPVNAAWNGAPPAAPVNPALLEGAVLLPLSNARNHPLENAALPPAQKLAALKTRISDVLAPFAQAEMNWDLSDGLARHVEALEALAPDAIAQLLATARKAAPKAKVFLHDFGILEGGARKLDDFLQKAVELQGSGVRLDGLSVTLEAFRAPPAPAEIIARLDRLAAANLPLRIAPLGFVGDFAPDTARAAAADLLLAVISQPAVQSIVIARADQAPWDDVLRNPPGRLKEWIPGMKYKARTDAEGRILLRVPAGRYAVTVSAPRGLQRAELSVTQGAGGSLDVRVPAAAAPKPAAVPTP
jgi:hypothetical protein